MPDTEGVVDGSSTVNAEGGQASTPATTTPAEPTPLELSDDTLVRVKGSDQPVKFSSIRGFQSQFTKASQRAAQLERQLAETTAAARAREEEAARYRTALGADKRTDPNEELLNALKGKDYISGSDAAGLLQHLLSQVSDARNGFNPRDQAILTVAQRLAAMERQFGTVAEERNQTQFRSKIQRFVKELDLPDDAMDLAQEIYLAYQGDDLDDEFPTILKNRWAQLEKAVRARDKALIDKQRQRAFTPSKGGNGSAGKPTNLASASAKEVADSLWDALGGSDS